MDVDLLTATAEDNPVLASLLKQYLHDFSEFEPSALSPHGTFDYAWLDSHVTAPDRASGGTGALASKGASGSPCRLSARQLERLSAALIGRLFHVRYTVRGATYLLHRLGFSAQVPAHRAAERDDADVEAWRESAWPQIKG